MKNMPRFACWPVISLAFCACPLFANTFSQTNLVSDISGMAAITDPNLKNPWGVAFSATSPFWVSDQASNLSTLYKANGAIVPLVVSVPPTSPPPTGPTGQVFNSAGAGNFSLNGKPSAFIFDTLAGTIDAWNGGSGTTASVVHTTAGAVYTGLALGSSGSSNYLYAANFAGSIDVFNSSFGSTTLSGSFKDPALPSGYVPYNIQNVAGTLFVEYAKVDPVTHQAAVGAGLGYVDEFDTNGNFLKRLASGGTLNAPWGVTVAPASFGKFGNDVLVGNFGNGEINAFDPSSGSWLGVVTDSKGNPLVNSGLWSINFGNGSADPNALYFAAGINNQADGLFGEIRSTPEPGAGSLAGIGGLVFGFGVWARRKRSLT